MNLLRFLLTSQLKRSQVAQKNSGFTLIELLVAMILAALVIAPLLGFMINILNSDRKEQAKANSEQEIKSALDYIAQDLSQAVYIYDQDGLTRNSTAVATTSGIRDQIPPFAPGSAAVGCNPGECFPVLVFWKRRPIPKVIPVGNPKPNCTATPDKCDDAFVYSLVGYYLIKNNDQTWSKAARIGRFEISDGVRNPTTPTLNDGSPNYLPSPPVSPGFQMFDIKAASNLGQSMNMWKKSNTAYTNNSSIRVLADYIDQSSSTQDQLTCDTTNIDTTLREQRVPRVPAAGTPPNSFYACINSNTTRNTARVYIRGNALARIQSNDVPNWSSGSVYFPSASIQIQGRGFLYTK